MELRMNPASFPESNRTFGPPGDLSESQCMSIRAYIGVIERGSLEGAHVVVTAWQPTPEEIELIKEGKPIFISFIGGLPPHFPTMSFHAATHPQ